MKDLVTRLGQAVLLNWTSIKVRLPRGNFNKRAVVLTWRLLVFWLGLVLTLPGLVLAQESSWNPPVQLRSSENFVYNPILLSDESGRLHLFWSEDTRELDVVDRQSFIYYMVKDQDSWLGPVDVLASDLDSITTLRGSINEYGRPFLVIGRTNANLQYSHAFQADAVNALSWQPLRGVTGRQIAGEISVGNTVHVVYGDVEGKIHYLRLNEDGDVESSQVITWLPGNQLLRSPPKMIQAADGTLHVVLPAITPPNGKLDSYYIRSEDDGESWTELTSISYPDRLAFSIAEDATGFLHVLFVGRAGVGGRHSLVSEDGGESWSEPLPISLPEEGSGLSGGDFALDSANRLHAIFGLANDAIVVHSEFDGVNWSNSEQISQRVTGQLEQMGIEITHGNRLHAVWQYDQNSIWYAEGIASAPEIEPEGIKSESSPEQQPTNSIDETMPEQALVVPTASGTFTDSSLQAQPAEVSSATSLLIAAAVSLLFIGLVVAVRYLLSRK